MASAPFSTAALAHSQSPAGASSSGFFKAGAGDGVLKALAGEFSWMVLIVRVWRNYHKSPARPKEYIEFSPANCGFATDGCFIYCHFMRVLIIGCGYLGLGELDIFF